MPRASQKYNLQVINPTLSKQWHPAKNFKLTPKDVTPNSGKKVWWKCEHGHEWQALINNRRKGTGCPFCSGRFATDDNNLSTLYPAIAKQWHPEKNLELKPTGVTPGSHKKVWWSCLEGHEWKSTVKNRVIGRGCPYCAGKIPTNLNNFEEVFPHVAMEWHPKKNKNRFPKEFMPQSNKKVWWKCSRGHEWQARIQDRTMGKNSCPYCSKQTSQLEIRLYCELKAILNGVEWRQKIDGFEIDILLKTQSIGIEVDGYYWHKNRQEPDRKKQQSIESQGITLIRIREKPLKILGAYDVLYEQKDSEKKIIKSLLKNLLRLLSTQETEAVTSYLKRGIFTNKSEFRKILSFLPGPPHDQSFESKRPELSTEWNHRRNNPLQPSMFPLQSNKKVWWKCHKGHEWEAAIYSRSKGYGCPYCSGRFATPENNLQVLKPDIAKEWHPIKNKNLTPKDVTPFSHTKAWWQCEKGHEWQAQVSNRVNVRGCPFCSGKRPSKEYNLKALHPNLASEWNESKNDPLGPEEVTPGSGKKVWWQCSKRHEWIAAIYSRVAGNGCPYCAGRKKSL